MNSVEFVYVFACYQFFCCVRMKCCLTFLECGASLGNHRKDFDYENMMLPREALSIRILTTAKYMRDDILFIFVSCNSSYQYSICSITKGSWKSLVWELPV